MTKENYRSDQSIKLFFYNYLMNTDYFNDYKTLNSVEALINKITNNQHIQPQIVHKKASIQRKTDKQSVNHLIDLNSINGLKIGIQNSNKLVNTLNYIRKKSSPLIYVFVENNFIIFTISSYEKFPVVILRLPIIEPYTYAHQIQHCYNLLFTNCFPNTEKSDKKTIYTFLIKTENSDTCLEYVCGSSEKLKIENITSKKKDTVLFYIFEAFKSTIFKTIPTSIENLTFNDIFNLEILIVSTYDDDNILNKITGIKSEKNTTNTLLIKNNEMKIIQKTGQTENEFIITNKNDKNTFSNTNLFWSDKINDMKLNMINCISLFKNYKKLISPRDKVYFMLCKGEDCIKNDIEYNQDEAFEVQTSAELYYLIRVISQEDVKFKNGMKFSNVFVNEEHMIEIYMCLIE